NDGNTVFSNMQVSAAPEPEPSPIQNAADMKVLVLRSDNGEVQYALRMEREQSEPVLLQWDFGDGNQSLLDRPIHLYAESGNYTVTVEVRSLRNGEIIGKASDELMVNRMQEVEPDQSQTNETTKSEGGSLFGLIGKLLLSIVFFGALGAAIMFIVSKIKEKGFSLEKTMEMAEQTIVKPPSPEPSADLPPMEIAVEEVEVPVEPPAPEPEPEPEASTPDWLQAGLQSAQETETSHAPDWLQAGMEKVEEQESTLETPAVPEDTSAEKEDAAREKKRRKRQRYRENVKKRKEEEEETEVVEGAEGAEVADANEPIAFIKAEDIEPLNPADDQKPA
ncbi:MAG: PKD domain-containing protein, partial [Candidatus Peregrinibacteria bacterium]|nr:PKD domain-containing protein [Candidatus Peregrinibacteria bacterium]